MSTKNQQALLPLHRSSEHDMFVSYRIDMAHIDDKFGLIYTWHHSRHGVQSIICSDFHPNYTFASITWGKINDHKFFQSELIATYTGKLLHFILYNGNTSCCRPRGTGHPGENRTTRITVMKTHIVNYSVNDARFACSKHKRVS